MAQFGGINVVALCKGAERYVFLYDDLSREEAVQVLGRFARNPELAFTWYDAAVLAKSIWELAARNADNRCLGR